MFCCCTSVNSPRLKTPWWRISDPRARGGLFSRGRGYARTPLFTIYGEHFAKGVALPRPSTRHGTRLSLRPPGRDWPDGHAIPNVHRPDSLPRDCCSCATVACTYFIKAYSSTLIQLSSTISAGTTRRCSRGPRRSTRGPHERPDGRPHWQRRRACRRDPTATAPGCHRRARTPRRSPPSRWR
jgi:hypothetical protein